jgi:hypothetical protein
MWLPHYKIIFLTSCLFLLLSVYQTSGQTRFYDGRFEKEQLKLFKEADSMGSAAMLIKRNNRRSITFVFFEEFNDTLVVCLNNKEIGKWILQEQNNPIQSSGYSGINVNFLLKGRKNHVTMRLMRQKKYIEFKIDKNYPVYSIQRYDNVWYVNARKYRMDLK